ncbi:MAG: methanogenesis marker 3 protein [Candidatus Methanoplasma sp.]|jgi:putative methanogenesis marker protein 3|nr:methanogenesis marker 3 protein [Candidatus Methanoplasma sp.]
MKVTVNGKEKVLGKGATLKDAVKDEAYEKDSLISIHLSTERLTKESNDFEIVTRGGTMVLRLDDTDGAKLWRTLVSSIKGSTARWSTRDIIAFGSFKTDIPADRVERRYKTYDCFFTLGGFDNHTTYVMIAKKDHTRAYGASVEKIGRITLGRHILDRMTEGEEILDIMPAVSETVSDNIIVTKDLAHPLEEGNSIDTNILIKLDERSPASAEQVLIVGSKGHFNITGTTGTMIGCGDDMDVSIPNEDHSTRDIGSVAVRNTGHGTGHILLYKERRQSSPVHNSAGTIERGLGIVSQAAEGDKITVITEPARVMSVGMTQSDGERFLSGFGIKQKRSGDTSDNAVIVDQSPEMTLKAISGGEVETFGVPKDKVFRIQLDEKHPGDVYYFRKVTGLSHKPIGSLKTQFSFPGMPMVTFYGDDERSKSLFPQDPFKKCKKGDIGITNQSRPHHGLIGIRLEDSKEYGPTGEEPYGTNIMGKFLDDLGRLGETEEEEIIYVMEENI